MWSACPNYRVCSLPRWRGRRNAEKEHSAGQIRQRTGIANRLFWEKSVCAWSWFLEFVVEVEELAALFCGEAEAAEVESFVSG